MSTSEKQINTNRQNAQKSTGPKTEQGKKNSSQNAISHGFHATDIVIDSPHLKESQTDYDQLIESLFNELKPIGVFQEHLVLKIANCIWRYKRAINAETATINNQLTASYLAPLPILSDDIDSADQPGQSTKSASSRSIPYGNMGRALLRYEWRLDRELYRTYQLFNHLKLMEKSNSLPDLISKK
ncbi:MAG: hypothetical protein IIC66_06015 [candidate division Zixibacteria bacterium]|nr:hypothetical protein [candidate division Zixibacteria bacterium]